MKICKAEGCDRKSEAKEYCGMHYKRFIKSISDELCSVYRAMKRRCLSKKFSDYPSYGGRGITVCDRWLGIDGFNNFKEDMGIRPTKKHSLDRKDNNKGYSPENCKWSNAHEQAANRRSNNDVVGVKFNHNKWQAGICIDNKRFYLGIYADKNDAIKARKEAELKYNIYNELPKSPTT